MLADSFKKIARSKSLVFGLFVPMIVALAICIICLHQLIPFLMEKNVSARELANLLTMMLLVMAILLLSVIGWAFKKKIVGPLAVANDIANKISDGDLVTHNDILGSDDSIQFTGTTFRYTNGTEFFDFNESTGYITRDNGVINGTVLKNIKAFTENCC